MKKIQPANSIGKVVSGILALCFALAACAPYSLVKSGKDVQVGPVFTVDTPINWSKSENGKVETWTIDGPQLQRLVFFKGVHDGYPLFPVYGSSGEKEMPVFNSFMNPLEIKEFIEASLTRSGAHQMVTKDLRPVKMDSLDGFRFEFSYFVESGLKYDGFVVGAKRQDRLLAIMYVGTALHHYGKHLDDAEKVVASVVVR
jgi:hypothetical protein